MRSHKDLDVWKLSIELVLDIYQICRQMPVHERYGLSAQMKRAAVSIPSNVAEGAARKSHKEFIQFLFISKSSAAEVQSHLYVAMDQGYITEKSFNEIYDKAEKVSKLTSGFIKYLTSQLKKPKQPN